MKLLKMTDYVLEQNKVLENYINHDKGALFKRCLNYAKFLKQPLKLEMFISLNIDDIIFLNAKAEESSDGIIIYIDNIRVYCEWHNHRTIESLTDYQHDFILTQSAINQINR